MLTKLHQKVERFETAVKAPPSDSPRSQTEEFRHCSRGKYKSRRGKIAAVNFNTHSGIIVPIYPYRLDNPEELIDDNNGDTITC
jgi:hypothetical protein